VAGSETQEKIMEWVETTGKTVADAREQALDRLGVAEDEAEFEVLEEPRSGLFGRTRGEARVRARIRPTSVRPKQDRRNRGRAKGRDGGADAERAGRQDAAESVPGDRPVVETVDEVREPREPRDRDGRNRRPKPQRKEQSMGAEGESDDRAADVAPEVVGEAASEFMTGLAAAFGTTASASVHVEGSEIDVRVDGSDLGLLIGPGGRTLMAVQDLARVASQRRLGDHDTRLRIDVAGYRERRRAALEKFATAVAHDVAESGRAKALEPMTSGDRKIVHDVIQGLEGVSSHSDGEDPRRRVVITPA
jgi:spoIIIJ-associated protein